MAFNPTTEQRQALNDLIQASGGFAQFIVDLENFQAIRRKQSAVTQLQAAVSLTVSDWTTVDAFLASSARIDVMRLPGIIVDLQAAVAARNAAAMGVLLVELYAAELKTRT